LSIYPSNNPSFDPTIRQSIHTFAQWRAIQNPCWRSYTRYDILCVYQFPTCTVF
jgi:hypothetical protein